MLGRFLPWFGVFLFYQALGVLLLGGGWLTAVLLSIYFAGVMTYAD